MLETSCPKKHNINEIIDEGNRWRSVKRPKYMKEMGPRLTNAHVRILAV